MDSTGVDTDIMGAGMGITGAITGITAITVVATAGMATHISASDSLFPLILTRIHIHILIRIILMLLAAIITSSRLPLNLRNRPNQRSLPHQPLQALSQARFKL